MYEHHFHHLQRAAECFDLPHIGLLEFLVIVAILVLIARRS